VVVVVVVVEMVMVVVCGLFPPYFTNSIPYMYSIC
jgi:hypothetical protein